MNSHQPTTKVYTTLDELRVSVNPCHVRIRSFLFLFSINFSEWFKYVFDLYNLIFLFYFLFLQNYYFLFLVLKTLYNTLNNIKMLSKLKCYKDEK